MILGIKGLLLIILYFIHCETVKDFNKLNLVRVNISDFVYKKLMISKDNILSATPLAVLDVKLLTKYHCYQNIRSSLWSLPIPVIFWTDWYIARITESVKKRNLLRNFTGDKVSILPPSGIVAFRITWRRSYIENLENMNVSLDTSWQDAQTDYVLPMRHNFVMEFNAYNENKKLCIDTKNKLLNDSMQVSEMTIDFQRIAGRKRNIPDIQIKINDIRSVKMYNESDCKTKSEDKCFVSKEFAEKWSYDVSTRMMDNVDIIHLNLQKDIFDAVFEYLCKNRMSIFEIELKTVRRLSKGIDNEMACKIPNNLYVIKVKPCLPKYDRYGYLRVCPREYLDYGNDVISKLNPYHSYNEKSQFSIPIVKLDSF